MRYSAKRLPDYLRQIESYQTAFSSYQIKRQLDLREVVDTILFVPWCKIQWRNL